MSASNILIGGESFREIREFNCYYIDKTDFLVELLSNIPAKVSLITRPRRFGKTLNMTCFRNFSISVRIAKNSLKGWLSPRMRLSATNG